MYLFATLLPFYARQGEAGRGRKESRRLRVGGLCGLYHLCEGIPVDDVVVHESCLY